LALTGTINGRYVGNELTQYLFHASTVSDYLASLSQEGLQAQEPPKILIELYFTENMAPVFQGDGNSAKANASGVSLEVAFNEDYKAEYQELIASNDIGSLPVEYYSVTWASFARDQVTARRIPIKPALIDSSTHRYQNGSDVYVARIIRDILEIEDVVGISQAYRKMRDAFMSDDAMERINERIKETARISDKDVRLSADLSPRNAWETSLMTYLDDIPFQQIGRGEQCIIKTKLALGHQKAREANVILIEEPENHLSHAKLNALIRDIRESSSGKQLLITTHSSFVANKLGIENLLLLRNGRTTRLRDLAEDTHRFFRRLAGYDTLRLLLCDKAILVEGDSDELVVQKAFMTSHDGRLPIEDGVDVISVGTSFLRFLEIAEELNIETVVVTDNDGDIEALRRKYDRYLRPDSPPTIRVLFDPEVAPDKTPQGFRELNYNTLEATMVRANGLMRLNDILGKEFKNEYELLRFMISNKTECALKLFDTESDISYPQYIVDAVE